MHTRRVGGWSLNHNADWSGDVILEGPGGQHLELPGFLFILAAQDIIGDLEENVRALVAILDNKNPGAM